MQGLMSLVGVVTIFALAYLLSNNRRAINRRTIGFAFLLQTVIAAIVLFVPAGGVVLDKVVKGVQYVISYGNDGIEFVFGKQINESLGFTSGSCSVSSVYSAAGCTNCCERATPNRCPPSRISSSGIPMHRWS